MKTNITILIAIISISLFARSQSIDWSIDCFISAMEDFSERLESCTTMQEEYSAIGYEWDDCVSYMTGLFAEESSLCFDE